MPIYKDTLSNLPFSPNISSNSAKLHEYSNIRDNQIEVYNKSETIVTFNSGKA
jgi:hypothetical protein